MSGIVLVFVVPALVGNDIAGELAVRFVVRHAVKRDVEVARTGGGASGSAFGSVDTNSTVELFHGRKKQVLALPRP